MGRVPLVLLPSGSIIEPLGDPAAAAPILGRPLASVQDEEARAAGCEPLRRARLSDLPAGPLLVARDDALFTRELLQKFMAAASAGGRRSWQPGQLALVRGVLTRFLEPLQSLPESPGEGETIPPAGLAHDGSLPLRHRLWALEAPVDGSALSRLPDQPLLVDPGEEVFRFPVQRALDPSAELLLPFTPVVFLELSHWVHVLRGNLVALLAGAARAARGSRWGLLRLILGARSLNPYRILARASHFGPGCDIHPSAVVEGSVLGAKVTVGANALVRFAVLGDGARVGDGAQVFASSLGAGATVSRMGAVVGSVLYDGANCGLPGMQLSLLAREAMLGSMALLADARFGGGNVRVRCRGRLQDSGSPVLGCCLGHGSLVALGARLAPGRVVPNGCQIVGSPTELLANLPDDLPVGRLLFVEGGKILDPLAR